MEIKIHVLSESSRNNDHNKSPGNFRTIFDKTLKLDQNKTYVFGLDKIATKTYSWYNISEQYKTIKFDIEFLQKKERNKSNPCVVTIIILN